jgi:protein O-GlcNAc transferase
MVDVLDQISHPLEALRKAAAVLRPGGVLVLGTPDALSSSWKIMEAEKVNPYWTDFERLHYFNRERLVALLRDCGLEVADFAVSGRGKAAMDIYAVKR